RHLLGDEHLLGQEPVGDRDLGPVGAADVADTGADDEEDDANLDGHEDGVGGGALADADDEDGGHRQRDEERRQVQPGAGRGERVGGQVFGDPVADDDGEEFVEVLRPGGGHAGAGHGVLEDQVPADDPGEQLAQGGVGVGVGAAGYRREGGAVGEARGGEGAADAGPDERQDARRPRVLGGHPAGHDEDARADDGPHAGGRQGDRPQDAPQPVFAGRLGLQGFQRFGP